MVNIRAAGVSRFFSWAWSRDNWLYKCVHEQSNVNPLLMFYAKSNLMAFAQPLGWHEKGTTERFLNIFTRRYEFDWPFGPLACFGDKTGDYIEVSGSMI